MNRWLVAVVLVAFIGACASTPEGSDDLAQSIGTQLSEQLVAPLTEAAENAVSWSESQTDLVLDAIYNLPLPEDVEDLIPGTHMQGGRLDDGSAYVGIAIAVFRQSEPDFCMVMALGTDGELEARPVAADPLEMCEDAEIPNLLEPTG